jgi:hypothetical protein
LEVCVADATHKHRASATTVIEFWRESKSGVKAQSGSTTLIISSVLPSNEVKNMLK